jgi:hypothetical protein
MGLDPTASLVTLEKCYVICPYWELNHAFLDIQPVAKPHTNILANKFKTEDAIL